MRTYRYIIFVGKIQSKQKNKQAKQQKHGYFANINGQQFLYLDIKCIVSHSFMISGVIIVCELWIIIMIIVQNLDIFWFKTNFFFFFYSIYFIACFVFFYKNKNI